MSIKASWPNAVKNTEKYYGVDWDQFLTNEGDTITSVDWIIPTGLTELDRPSTLNNITRIKLRADAVGIYQVTCTIQTIDGIETQIFKQDVRLKVI